MIVADPIGAKIVPNYESSGRDNITGTRNRAPATVQMKALQSYRKFKRLRHDLQHKRAECCSQRQSDAQDCDENGI